MQSAHAKRALLAERESLLCLLARLEPDANATGPGDEVDRVHAAERTELTLANRERWTAQVVAIERALGKMGAGTFGICETCGVKVDAGRLRALPLAERCIDCERVLEQMLAEEGR